MCLCEPGRYLADEILQNELQLWELPTGIRSLYYLGEHYGLLHSQARLEELERECDTLFGIAARGGFTRPLPPQGLTYAELCRARGEYALADRIEVDWRELLEDKDASRLDLIEERWRNAPSISRWN